MSSIAANSPRTLGRLAELLTAVALVTAAAAIVIEQGAVRALEAVIAEPAVALALGTSPASVQVFTHGDYIVFPLAQQHVALSITAACTSAIMVVPMLLAVAVLLAIGRTHLRRGLLGLAVGLATVIVVNVLRIGTIAFAVEHWGLDPGYEISHKLVGSVLAVLGFAAACILLVRIAVSTRKPAGR
jgi:exosortase/archaeosortase family protein